MTRLILADDHPLVRRAVASLLKGDPVVEVIREVGDFDELFEALSEEEPDLVLMDVNMPGGDGIEAVRRIRRRHPEVAVLVLSGLPEEELVLRLVQSGAAGYVEKQAAPETLRDAIHAVARGGVYVGPAGAAALARAAGPTGAGRDHDQLSERELQVLRLLGEGQQVGDIARQLNLSPKTVSTYRTRILKKMDLSSTAEIIRYAIRTGLVS